MIDDVPSNRPSETDVSTRFNPKVQERKLQAQTVWAEMIRQQQKVAEQLAQQEKEMKKVRQAELNEALSAAVNEKSSTKQIEEMIKQRDHLMAIERKEEYDRLKIKYLEKVKQDKREKQRELDEEYQKNQRLKEDERRRKVEQEKEIAKKMAYNALDSLEKEKLERERKRKEYLESLQALERERQEKIRREKESVEKEKEDYNHWWRQEQQKDEKISRNYKMFYQQLNGAQLDMMDMHNKKVKESERTRDWKIDEFINKGINQMRARAEEEERRKKMKREEQIREVNDSIRTQIQEKQDKTIREKLGYRAKVQETLTEKQLLEERNEKLKRDKLEKMMQYRDELENQIKTTGNLKKKEEYEFSERDKKNNNSKLSVHPNILSGITNSKVETVSSTPKKANYLELSKSQDYGRFGALPGMNDYEQNYYSPQNGGPYRQGLASPGAKNLQNFSRRVDNNVNPVADLNGYAYYNRNATEGEVYEDKYIAPNHESKNASITFDGEGASHKAYYPNDEYLDKLIRGESLIPNREFILNNQ